MGGENFGGTNLEDRNFRPQKFRFVIFWTGVKIH